MLVVRHGLGLSYEQLLFRRPNVFGVIANLEFINVLTFVLFYSVKIKKKNAIFRSVGPSIWGPPTVLHIIAVLFIVLICNLAYIETEKKNNHSDTTRTIFLDWIRSVRYPTGHVLHLSKPFDFQTGVGFECYREGSI